MRIWPVTAARTVAVAIALAGSLLATQAMAQTVSLAGVLGGKALLIVDGGVPKAVAVGQTHEGVKVLQAEGDRAVVELAGAKRTLRMGDVPASVAGGAPAASSGGRIVLPAGSGGHFLGQGLINGRPVTMLVDTGATSIAIGMSDADRLGLDYKNGVPIRLMTANGAANGWRVKLSSVRLGDVNVYEVDAVITPTSMPFVLLGNSFLSRFEMNRSNDQLVLVKRY